MTLCGKPAVKRGACQRLDQNCGKRGRALVSIETAGEDVVVLRWDPPRTYDTVAHFIEQHLEKYTFPSWHLSMGRQMTRRWMARRRTRRRMIRRRMARMSRRGMVRKARRNTH